MYHLGNGQTQTKHAEGMILPSSS